MQSAKVYQRNGMWLLHSDCKTTDGLWIASDPFLRSNGYPHDLGKCLLETLNASKEGIPHPTTWNGIFSPALDLAGVKSWNVFANGALLIGAELNGDHVTLTPHRNLGPRVGFEPIEEEALHLSADATPEEYGLALYDVVGRCVA